MRLRTLSRLRTDRRGAAVIELALAAPVMAAVIIGMTDMARAYSLKLVVEQAAQRTIEQIEQQKSVASSYNTAITTEATSAMTAAGYSTGNTITPDSWLECSSNGTTWTRQTSFTGACAANDALRQRHDFAQIYAAVSQPRLAECQLRRNAHGQRLL